MYRLRTCKTADARRQFQRPICIRCTRRQAGTHIFLLLHWLLTVGLAFEKQEAGLPPSPQSCSESCSFATMSWCGSSTLPLFKFKLCLWVCTRAVTKPAKPLSRQSARLTSLWWVAHCHNRTVTEARRRDSDCIPGPSSSRL